MNGFARAIAAFGIAAAVTVAAFAARAEPASAGGCTAQPLGEIPVATLNRQPVVTLSANGHPVVLLLDTGAERTVLTPAVAERIGGSAPRIEFQRQLRGIAGSLATREIELQRFFAGRVEIPLRRAMVAPLTMNPAPVLATPLDGLLGADALGNFDIDLDLPHQRLQWYAKGACGGAPPPWASPDDGISTGRSVADRLFFPVLLDGHRLFAFIDTGAQTTTLTAPAARRMGLTQPMLDRDPPITIRGPTAGELSAYVHRFSRWEIGRAVIRNPELVVADQAVGDADVVLGIDFLASRRVWMSWSSRRIFLSTPR